MAKKPIYKDDILDALEDEPLTRGTFAAGALNEPVSNSICRVCAMGALIRKQKPYTNIDDANKLGNILTENISTPNLMMDSPTRKPKNYLSALSVFWEGLQAPIEEAREITIDWVEDTFPDDEILGYL